MTNTSGGAVPAAPPLALPVSGELTWLATELIPAVRMSRPDLTARRGGPTWLPEQPMTDEWFARAAAMTAGLYRKDHDACLRAKRLHATTSPQWVADMGTLFDFSRAAKSVFFQFCGHPYLVMLNSWAHHTAADLGTPERSGVIQEKHAAGDYHSVRRLQQIATDTAAKVSAQLSLLSAAALQLGFTADVPAELRVCAELLAGGAQFGDATAGAALVVA